MKQTIHLYAYALKKLCFLYITGFWPPENPVSGEIFSSNKTKTPHKQHELETKQSKPLSKQTHLEKTGQAEAEDSS